MIPVSVEVGSKRVFARAIGWPGWCRGGRDEAAALGALVAQASRYRAAVGSAITRSDPSFVLPASVDDLDIVEHVEGGSGTDFGAPGAPSPLDESPMSEAELAFAQRILQSAWETFDAAEVRARGMQLRKGPRGGGRDLAKIVAHVMDAEGSYLTKLGARPPRAGDAQADESLWAAQRAIILETLADRVHGTPIRDPSRARSLWLPRFFVRYAGWHILDHAWEIEDRAEQ